MFSVAVLIFIQLCKITLKFLQIMPWSTNVLIKCMLELILDLVLRHWRILRKIVVCFGILKINNIIRVNRFEIGVGVVVKNISGPTPSIE